MSTIASSDLSRIVEEYFFDKYEQRIKKYTVNQY